MQIFLGISWLTYLCYALVLLVIYYGFVGYKYYRVELLDLWENRISKGKFNNSIDEHDTLSDVTDDENGVVEQYITSHNEAEVKDNRLSGEEEWTEDESEEFVQELITRQKEEEFSPYSVANVNNRVNGVEQLS